MIAAPTPSLESLFSSTLEQQLANERSWSRQRGWRLPRSWFDNVDTTPSGLARGLIVDVLYSILPARGRGGARIESVQRTFDERWTLGATLSQLDGWRQPTLSSHSEKLRLLEGIEYEPGVFRATLSLCSHWGARPIDVRGSDSAGPEVLAAMAHFPDWIRLMDGRRIPYVCLAAYQVKDMLFGGKPWSGVPDLEWYSVDRQVELGIGWEGANRPYWACPRVVSRTQ